MDGQKERQGDFVFSANVVGDYSFCFDNEMSTFAEKYVDFEIAVENEARAQLPSKQGTTPEQTSVLEESIFKVSGQLSLPSRATKSTSEPVKTATSPPSTAPRAESSTLA